MVLFCKIYFRCQSFSPYSAADLIKFLMGPIFTIAISSHLSEYAKWLQQPCKIKKKKKNATNRTSKKWTEIGQVLELFCGDFNRSPAGLYSVCFSSADKLGA